MVSAAGSVNDNHYHQSNYCGLNILGTEGDRSHTVTPRHHTFTTTSFSMEYACPLLPVIRIGRTDLPGPNSLEGWLLLPSKVFLLFQVFWNSATSQRWPTLWNPFNPAVIRICLRDKWINPIVCWSPALFCTPQYFQ